MIRQELKLAIFNRRTLLGIVIILICLLGISVPEWIISKDWGTEYRQSALQQSISGIFFGGVMLLLPFCSSLSYATMQVDELDTSIMRWKLIRSSTRRYGVSKIAATATSSGITVAVAFALHSILWNTIALPCDPIAYPYHEIVFSDTCLYRTWYSTCYGVPMYISIMFGLFICASVWGTVALAISIWLPDHLLTLIIPSCIYYLLSANILNSLLGWRLPHPATLYNDGLTLVDAIQSLIEYLIIFVSACIIYMIGIKRRAQHA